MIVCRASGNEVYFGLPFTNFTMVGNEAILVLLTCAERMKRLIGLRCPGGVAAVETSAASRPMPGGDVARGIRLCLAGMLALLDKAAGSGEIATMSANALAVIPEAEEILALSLIHI